MMRLILASKSTKGIKEKLLKSWSQKSGQKYLRKSQKWKILQLNKRDESTQKDSYIDASHNSPMVLYIAKTKRLKCPCGLKGKLHLIKGSLVWLPLCHTRHHQTDHLSLHFRVTSMMMPRAPPVVATSPILRQNWETLTRLASRRSKPPNVDACPHTFFIRSSVLRRKPTNLLPLGFEAQTKKPLNDFKAQITKPPVLVLRTKPRNHFSGFEAKPLTNRRHRFWG
jgi:hypothetical protein